MKRVLVMMAALVFLLALILVMYTVPANAMDIDPTGAIEASTYGALGNNTNDDTVELQIAINAAGAATPYKLHIAAGTYVISDELNIPNNVIIFGDGRDSTIIRQIATGKDGIDIGRSHDVILTKLQVKDITNPGYNAESRAIHIYDGYNNILDDIKVVNSDDAGVRFGHYNGTTFSHDNILRYSYIYNTKEGSGIELIKGTNNIAHNNYVSGSSQYGIRVCGSQGGSVYNNEFVSNGHGINAQHYTGEGGDRATINVNIHHNRSYDSTNSSGANVSIFGDVNNVTFDSNRIGYSATNTKDAVQVKTSVTPLPTNNTFSNNTFVNIGDDWFSSMQGIINTNNTEVATEPTGDWKEGTTPPPPSPTPGITRHEEDDTNIVYSNIATGYWDLVANAGYSGGNQRTSNDPTHWAEFTFTGTGIKWVTTRGTSRGIAKVYIDGVYQQDIDNYATTTQYQVVAYEKTGLVAGNHKIKIEITNTRNPSATSYVASIDAFDVTDQQAVPPVTDLQKMKDMGLIPAEKNGTDAVTFNDLAYALVKLLTLLGIG